jgi:DprA/Smf-like nucleotide binding protein involved in DNA uptake
VKRGGAIPAAVARAVRLRDRDRCRVPGCRRRRYVEIHHNEERSQGGEHSRYNCFCLCSTHHGHVHVKKLRIEGDAEVELFLYDADDNLITDPILVTQSGSLQEPDPQAATAARVLALMGQRGGWHLDDICSSTGLPASEVGGALFLLELDRRVQRDPFGRYQRALGGQ